MRPSYKISIPEPCHESWAAMTPTQKGRHCDSCAKEIIDFSTESNEYLFKRISKGEHLCGRFRKDQLDTKLVLNRKSKYNIKGWLAGLFLPLALFFTKESYAQGEPVKTEQVPSTNKYKTSLGIGVQHRKLIQVPAWELKGTVKSPQAKPAEFVTIRNINTKKKTQTNKDGFYSIIVNAGDVIEFTFPEYEKQSIVVKENDRTLDVKFNPEVYEMMTLGIVITQDTFEHAPKHCEKECTVNHEHNFAPK